MMAFSSLYWMSGFGTLMVTTLSELTRVITTELFQPELMLQIVEKHKVSSSIFKIVTYLVVVELLNIHYHRLVSLSPLQIIWHCCCRAKP